MPTISDQQLSALRPLQLLLLVLVLVPLASIQRVQDDRAVQSNSDVDSLTQLHERQVETPHAAMQFQSSRFPTISFKIPFVSICCCLQ